MKLKFNTNLTSVGGGDCCECLAFANSLENRKQYIRLLNSINAPQESGV